LTKSIEKYSNNYIYYLKYALSINISWWIQWNKFGIVDIIIFSYKFGQSWLSLT